MAQSGKFSEIDPEKTPFRPVWWRIAAMFRDDNGGEEHLRAAPQGTFAGLRRQVMKTMIKDFMRTEDGAAVVDMTMLMAALVGLCLAVSVQVSNGMEDLTGDLETTLVDQDADAAF